MYRPNTIYIGGKVTGLPIETVVAKFKAAEEKLLNSPVTHAFVAVNPIQEIQAINEGRVADELPEWTDGTHRKEIMGYCLYLLSTCSHLYLLPDWNESKGAIMEREFAIKMKMPITYL